MITALIIILAIVLILSGFVILRMMKKQELAEDIIISYNEYLDRMSRVIELSNVKLKELDHKGTFESDDEIGFFFKGVEELQSILNEFNIKNLVK